MTNWLNKIINDNKTIYFVSPHLDDAIYSAGGLVSFLPHNKVHVINVFTKADKPPYTLTALKYLNSCGFTNAEELYHQRIKEDKKIFKQLGVKVTNLDFSDAIFRKFWRGEKYFGFIPEIYHTHPVTVIKNRFILIPEKNLCAQIYKRLDETIEKGSCVFGPMGIGSHVDHMLVKDACLKLKDRNIIFWSDYPYNLKKDFQSNQNYWQEFKFNKNQKKRANLIKRYQTQFDANFPNRIVLKDEKYFINQNGR